LLEKCKPQRLSWACLKLEKGEEGGIQYPCLGGVSCKWVFPPCFCHKPAKNQQVKLVGKAAEMTKKYAENLC
jgi:hypothetical protein